MHAESSGSWRRGFRLAAIALESAHRIRREGRATDNPRWMTQQGTAFSIRMHPATTSFRSANEAAKPWTNTELPQLEAYLGERGVPPLNAQQKKVLSEAYVAAKKWEPTGDKPAPAVLYRLQNERIGILAGHALDPFQREAVAGYLTFINARSQIMGQVLNPNDPDGVVITPGVAPR
jgi:hypothetical protein